MKLLAALVAVTAAAWALFYLEYQADLRQARALLASRSDIAQTRCGPIEYRVTGSGPAVLLVHGAGGGYSQVAGLASALARAGFQAIAMSRFGYLRTPLPADASAEAQADAHACLLDALGVQEAAAVGASAGAPSALLFCIRHAERCTALALLVPAAYAARRGEQLVQPPSPFMQFVLDRVLTTDAVMWTILRFRPEILVETALATPLADFRAAPPAERGRALAMARDIFPVSVRTAGLANDGRICTALPRYALEEIRAPTLAISVENDLYGTYASAQYTASQVAGARFVGYPGGGHVWLGHDDEVRREIIAFLEAS